MIEKLQAVGNFKIFCKILININFSGVKCSLWYEKSGIIFGKFLKSGGGNNKLNSMSKYWIIKKLQRPPFPGYLGIISLQRCELVNLLNFVSNFGYCKLV